MVWTNLIFNDDLLLLAFRTMCVCVSRGVHCVYMLLVADLCVTRNDGWLVGGRKGCWVVKCTE